MGYLGTRKEKDLPVCWRGGKHLGHRDFEHLTVGENKQETKGEVYEREWTIRKGWSQA